MRMVLVLAAILICIAASAWAMWGGHLPALPPTVTLLTGGANQLTCGALNCAQ